MNSLTEAVLKIDGYLLELIYFKSANSYFDQIFPIITDLHKNIFFIISLILILIYFLFKKYKFKSTYLFLGLLASIGLSDFTGSKIKHTFDRPRPFAVSENNIIQKSPALPTKSFYSNHASNSFALATYTSLLVPELKLILYVFATISAYSRVYNGVHYPTDVLAGAFMGSVIAFIFYILMTQVFKLNLRKMDDR